MSSKASDIINRAISDSTSYRATVEEERIRREGKEKMARTTRDLAAAARAEYEARLRAALDEIKQQTQEEICAARRERERLGADTSSAAAATGLEERGKGKKAAEAAGWLDLGSGILEEYLDDLTPRYQDRGVQAEHATKLRNSTGSSPKPKAAISSPGSSSSTSAEKKDAPPPPPATPAGRTSRPPPPPPRGIKRHRISIVEEDTPPKKPERDKISRLLLLLLPGPPLVQQSAATATTITPTPASQKYPALINHYRRLIYGEEEEEEEEQAASTASAPPPSAPDPDPEPESTASRRWRSRRSTANPPSSYDVKEYYRNFKL
ncbi:hypothetical protein F5X96DRAFT_675712 [Biscogniauxia mediterranea]|nr:hypothetical protein F5X96DRAFT_675712 [Biscogniauxia mediterranea]